MKRLIRWTLNHVPRPLLQRLVRWCMPLVALLLRGRGVACRVRRPLPPLPALRLRRDAPQCPLSALSRAPNATACCGSTSRAKPTSAPTRPACCTSPRGMPHAPAEALLRRMRRSLRHGRPRKSARRPALRRAAHPAARRVVRRPDLQPPARTRGRRPPRAARAAPHPASGRLGHPPLARGAHARAYVRGRHGHRPRGRTRIFGQYDHRRIYGADYADRLRAAGFEADDIDYAARFTAGERRTYALPDDRIYVVRRIQ